MLQGNTLRFNAAFLDRTRTLSGNRCDASESLLCAFGCSGALGRPGSMGGTGGSQGFKVLRNSRIAGFLSHPQRIAFDPFPDHGYRQPVEEQVLIEQPMLVESAERLKHPTDLCSTNPSLTTPWVLLRKLFVVNDKLVAPQPVQRLNQVEGYMPLRQLKHERCISISRFSHFLFSVSGEFSGYGCGIE